MKNSLNCWKAEMLISSQPHESSEISNEKVQRLVNESEQTII